MILFRNRKFDWTQTVHGSWIIIGGSLTKFTFCVDLKSNMCALSCRAKFNIEPNGGGGGDIQNSSFLELLNYLKASCAWMFFDGPLQFVFKFCHQWLSLQARHKYCFLLTINICIWLWLRWQAFQNIYVHNSDVYMLDFRFIHVPMSLRKNKYCH